MTPIINIDAREAESLKPIPEGPYSAHVKEVGEVTEGPKAHYIPVKVEINEGEHEGRTFYVNLPIEGKGAGIMIDFINKATGSDYDVDEVDDLDFDTDDLIGCEVTVHIKNEEYPKGSGDFRSGVKSTSRKGGSTPDEEEDD